MYTELKFDEPLSLERTVKCFIVPEGTTVNERETFHETTYLAEDLEIGEDGITLTGICQITKGCAYRKGFREIENENYRKMAEAVSTDFLAIPPDVTPVHTADTVLVKRVVRDTAVYLILSNENYRMIRRLELQEQARLEIAELVNKERYGDHTMHFTVTGKLDGEPYAEVVMDSYFRETSLGMIKPCFAFDDSSESVYWTVECAEYSSVYGEEFESAEDAFKALILVNTSADPDDLPFN